MGISQPYHRICRPFSDGYYSGHDRYIDSPEYAVSPESSIRAFLLIQKDLLTLFDYVEPSDINLKSYSYRINELIIRACIEIEANCKSILIENGYHKNPNDFSMSDYQKINTSHRLSSYKAVIPYWTGKKTVRSPYSSWKKNKPLKWYQTYNTIKHSRHKFFNLANLDTALDSICGLLIILSSQFYTHDFSSSPVLLSISGPVDGSETAIGDYFRIFFPTDWPKRLRYNFDWANLPEVERAFQNYDYN